ncbi:AsmA family protein [Achromobacter ruhlandii]|uniref:AsmA family protein n=1 Tax=Achromobacter ruhlandii TaxID=72557 RepID=UPI0006C132C3|nr:AsmA family protein [Achromobacter ruhlandii]ALX86071.1 cell envelope biogenesis protein AsmA [Achromobacter denitrificans]AMG44964.1 AsmA family protein [Achromobacter xylosoxidans]MEB6660052.1 AsmA family protein [Achromobacter ruhlandii]OCZ68017.1 cell envelope biogenesis protein AsmA [Achromobacter xylosoxidans]ODA03352.1 cell envelope biogenesis protein AsmA [Achromobacter xylosoxidans]
MKTWFKRILIGLVVLVVVAVVGLAIFLLTFDPNAYKYKLEELVQERYHRTLTIDGEIELSLFPRIGLSVQGVSLSEVNSTETFASIQSTRLAVAVWPLLSNSFVVDHVAISGFKARVVRGKDGQFNFSNLVGGTAPVVATPANPAEALAGAAQTAAQALTSGTLPPSRNNMQIDIAGLDLKDGEVLLQDEMSGMAVAVTKINANTGRVTFNQPFDVRLTARLEGGNPRIDANLTGQALLTLDPSAKRYAAQKLDLRMDGKLPGAEAKSLAMRGNLAFNGQKSALDVAGLEVVFQGDVTDPAARATNVDASVAMPKLSIDPHKSQLQIEKLAVRAKGGVADGPFEFAVDAPALNISPTQATGEALTGRVRISGLDASFGLNGISGNATELDIKEAKLDSTSKKGERVVKLTFASPLSLNLLQRRGGLAGLRGDVNITDPGLPKGSLQIPVIGSLNVDLLKDTASSKINAVLEGGKFDLTADIAKLSDAPQVNFALAVDTLDLDKLVPPAAAAAAPAKPPADGKKDENKPAQPAPAAPVDDTINLSALVGPSVNGTLKVGKLVVRGLKADDVAAALKLDRGKLDISSLTAGLYGGKLAGALSLDAAQGNQLATKMSLAGIAIEPLLMDLAQRDVLSGTGSLALDLKTAGANSYAMKSGLGGTLQVRLRDGAVKGINLTQTLRELKAALKPESQDETVAADTSKQTAFSEMDADLAFTKGVASVKRLNVVSPLLRVTQGEPATIDFVRSELDLVARARVVNPAADPEGKELIDLKDVTIPVHVKGPFDKPSYTLLWKDAVAGILKRSLENKLREAVTGKGKGGAAVDKALKGLLGK